MGLVYRDLGQLKHKIKIVAINIFYFTNRCSDRGVPVSHVCPTKSTAHLHENEYPSFVQISQLLQGDESQGLGFGTGKV